MTDSGNLPSTLSPRCLPAGTPVSLPNRFPALPAPLRQFQRPHRGDCRALAQRLAAARLHPLNAALLAGGLAAGQAVWAQQPLPALDTDGPLPTPASPPSGLPPLQLQPSLRLQDGWPQDLRRQLPIHLQADSMQGQADISATLLGNAELRQGDTVVRANRLDYTLATDTVQAQGDVRIRHHGNLYSGAALQMELDAFRGQFTQAAYHFPDTGGHGEAALVEFMDRDQSIIHQATYTTCQRKDHAPQEPDWLLRARTIELDRVNDVGIAYGGLLTFKGVPVLPVPAISFPLSDRRKSGLLPPTVGMDSASGIQYAQPYYWNIAPNRDATITPAVMSKRGLNLGTTLRYLQPRYSGTATLNYMPDDRLRHRRRWSYHWHHLDRFTTAAGNVGMDIRLRRVSDDDYWRDFSDTSVSGSGTGLTGARLLESVATLDWQRHGHHLLLRAQKWQTLQDADTPITPPFDRLPQLQWNYAPATLSGAAGLDWSIQADSTRFAARTLQGSRHPDNGQRTYLHAQASRPMQGMGGFLTPRIQLHASHYKFERGTDRPLRTQSFVIPTVSLDSGLIFERTTTVLGHTYLQTLEPRAFYTWSPYRNQSGIPLYDTVLTDFNLASIYSENSYTGHDRIADNHMLTLGLTSRYLNANTGAEVARFGIAQRLRLNNQRNTLGYDTPGQKGWSDVLLGANMRWGQRWSTDTLLQYNQDASRIVRSSISGRYSPGPYRTISTAYRYIRPHSGPLAHDGSEQIDFSWQWPLGGKKALVTHAPGNAGQGRWYSVGRLNYSMQEKKLVDAIIGLEYESCCWTGRMVLERLQSGTTQTNTRLLLQLEFKGFSRLNFGSNPLTRLQQYVPGYQTLDNRPHTTSRPPPPGFTHYD